jgi:hypothetical protein
VSLSSGVLKSEAVLKSQVFKGLTQLSLHTLGYFPLDRHREIDSNLEVLTSPKFREELHAKAVPGLGWHGANEPKDLLLWARRCLWLWKRRRLRLWGRLCGILRLRLRCRFQLEGFGFQEQENVGFKAHFFWCKEFSVPDAVT